MAVAQAGEEAEEAAASAARLDETTAPAPAAVAMAAPAPPPAAADKGKQLMDFLKGKSHPGGGGHKKRSGSSGGTSSSTTSGLPAAAATSLDQPSTLDEPQPQQQVPPPPLPPPIAGDPWSTVGTASSVGGRGGGYADGLATLQRLAASAATAAAIANAAGTGLGADTHAHDHEDEAEVVEVEALLREISRWNAFGPVLNYDHNDRRPAGSKGKGKGSGGGDGVKADDPEQHEAASDDDEEDRGYDYVIAIMTSSRPAYLSLLLEALDRCGTNPAALFSSLFWFVSARFTKRQHERICQDRLGTSLVIETEELNDETENRFAGRTPRPESLLVIVSHDGLDPLTIEVCGKTGRPFLIASILSHALIMR
eukprot:COSAG06_NODE_6598_length_2860_cov_1.817095_2_plen_368_part_00